MKVIFVDDQKSMLLVLEKMVSKISEIEIAGTFQSSCEAYNFLKENKVDIAFVDVKMPEENGLDFARKIMTEFEHVNLVFITSFKRYALEAFDVNAIDYIVKPVSKERVEFAINKIMKKRMGTPVKNSGSMTKISVFCLGGLDVIGLGGKKVAITSSKSRELFAFLLINYGRFVSKWSVIENVFGEMHPRNAEIYLNTAIYRLRKTLEFHGMKDSVISANESYQIDTQSMYIDFTDFESRVNALAHIDEFNIEEAKAAEKLFGGQLLEDKGYSWSFAEQERITEIYWEFANKLINYFIKQNDLASSLVILKKMERFRELDGGVQCLLMKIYAKKRDRMSLINQYSKYVKLLKEELGIHPEKYITDLYTALINTFER